MTGIPGLSSIPILGKLFSGNSMDRNRDELMIALIPHIIRRQDITPSNLKEIAVGNTTTIHLNYAPKAAETTAPPGGSGASGTAAPAPPAAAVPAALPAATAPAIVPPAAAPPATAPRVFRP